MKSARIIITSFGSFGDVYPYIGLALGLKERGHRPVLAMAPSYRATVQREGLEFHPVRPDLDASDRETVRRIMDPTRGTRYIVQELILASLRDTFEDLKAAAVGDGGSAGAADLMVTHPVTFAAPLVAESQGLPWVSTVLAPMSFFSRYDLPVFPPMPWAKRLERVPGMAGALVALARGATRRWMEPVDELRGELGLPPGGDPLYEGQHSPHQVLGLFSPELAKPQPDWPPGVRITGAIPYNGSAGSSPLSPDLEAFLGGGPAPLVFTLGSSAVGAAGDFYRVSAEAAARLGARAVLLVGSHPENHPPGPLPDGVFLAAFAPHSALFPRASVVIHQGGAGTLHQGLRAGRPTLVVPFAHDQPDNAWRVRQLGVSRTLPPRRYSVSRVTREVQFLLRDGEVRERAAAVAQRVQAERPVEDACDAIEGVLGRGRR